MLQHLSLLNVKDIIPEDDTKVKNEADAMIEFISAFQNDVTNYASHRLCVNIQFNAIILNINYLKNDTSSVILKIGHKQKMSP